MQGKKGFIRRFGIFFLTGLLVLITIGQAAADGIEDARSRGKLLAGVKTDFPPFGYLESNGAYAGFDVEIARYLATAIFDGEPKVEFVTVTTGDRITFLYAGWIDVIIATMTVMEERRQVLEFSDPYFISGSLLLVRKDSPINGVEDLEGKKVAVIEGAIQAKDLEQLAPKAKQEKFEKVTGAMEALKSGKVDAFCEDAILILNLAKQDKELRPAGKAFIPRPYAMAVTKGDVASIAWINKQLSKMKSDGTYDRLWKKYFGEFEASLIKP
jgi:ABC-type amino acid transport substrate-binding protein